VKTEIAAKKSISSDYKKEHGRARGKYDAALYRRSTPIRDPFHMEGIARVRAEQERVGQAPLPGQIAASAPETVSLKGVMIYGSDRVAMIETGGRTETYRVGEGTGTWRVADIQAESVTLSDGHVLTTR